MWPSPDSAWKLRDKSICVKLDRDRHSPRQRGSLRSAQQADSLCWLQWNIRPTPIFQARPEMGMGTTKSSPILFSVPWE